MFRSCAALVLALATLAGCSSVEASPSTASATPNLPCTLPYGTHVALLSPAPGSSGVAAGSAPVVIVASHDLPKTVAVVAISTKGRVSPGGTLERTARPGRPAKTGFTNPVYYRAGGLMLNAKRHYTLALDDLAQNWLRSLRRHDRQRSLLDLT